MVMTHDQAAALTLFMRDAGASGFEIELTDGKVTKLMVRYWPIASGPQPVRSIGQAQKATEPETKAAPKEQFDGMDLDVLTRSAT